MIQKNMNSTPRKKDIEAWLVREVAKSCGLLASEVDVRTEFAALGFDSASAVAMAGSVERWLGVEVDGTTLFDHRSIERFAAHLLTLVAPGPSGR